MFDISTKSIKLPSVPGIAGEVKKLAHNPVGEMKKSVENLLTHVVPKDVHMPWDIDFGGKGRDFLENSPLGGFLGDLGILKPQTPQAANESGSRIPGGRSLYSEGKGMYHKGAPGAPDTYAFENTPEGIQFAADRGYASIDLDMQLTKDGIPVATHWSQPMQKDGFYDPSHKLGGDTKISEMTLAEVMRLRNEDGQSQIYPMSTMIEELKKNGIAGDLEAKDDPRFADDKVMGGIAQMVRNSGIRANLKSIDRGSRSFDILEAAQKQGFWVRTAAGNNREGRQFGYGRDEG